MRSLPRLQAFEFNDLPASPHALRETIVEALSRTLRWGHILRGLVGPFEEFVARSGATEALDLCAGAGGPAQILVEEIVRAGRRPPQLLLTDLFPRTEAWAAIRRAHPGAIDFVAEPVDATAIPEALARGRARVIINALHHCPPEVARAVFADAARDSAGLFIAEGFARNPLQFVNFAFAGLPALLLNPLLSPSARIEKALLTFCTPVVLGASVWDGLVSTLRVYEEDELRAMAASVADGWTWEYGTYAYPPCGTGYFFYGVPARRR